MSFRCKYDNDMMRDVRWQYIKNGWVSVVTVCSGRLERFSTPVVPNVSNLDLNDALIVSWRVSGLYSTLIELQINDGDWELVDLLSIGINEINLGDIMEFNPGDTIRVRAKHKDSLGNYSKYYTYAEITIEEDCIPLSDPMDGDELLGELIGSATYDSENGYVVLNPEELGLNGQVDYANYCTLPEAFTAEFDFKYVESNEENGDADAVYFYFFCEDIPITEGGEFSYDEEENSLYTKGFVVGFSHYNNEVRILYVNNEFNELSPSSYVGFSFEEGEWYRAKIIFYNGIAQVHLNDEFTLQLNDLPTDISSDQIHYGVGARSGGEASEHRVRELTVVEYEQEEIPNVDDFMLFSWGKQVWPTWKQNNYMTEIEYMNSENEEWVQLNEEYVPANQGDEN